MLQTNLLLHYYFPLEFKMVGKDFILIRSSKSLNFQCFAFSILYILRGIKCSRLSPYFYFCSEILQELSQRGLSKHVLNLNMYMDKEIYDSRGKNNTSYMDVFLSL